MKTISVPLSGGRSYGVCVGAPLKGLGLSLRRLVAGRRALVVSPRPVARLYARETAAGLKASGFLSRLAVIPDGERHKSLDAVRRLYREALAAGLGRKDVVVALGGGVTGDMAGFLAATYMRGVAVAQVPTTLLAMVDAAIGGKTGVDLPEGKNLVGAFHQPVVVWCEPAVLKTLPERERRTGMAEVIKYGLINDERILEIVRTETPESLWRRAGLLAEVVSRCAAVKARVVSADERETKGLREILNLGHTFGHALETVTGYSAYTHGEAVAVGMCAAARLAASLGTFTPADVPAVDALMARWGLPSRVRRPVSRAKVLHAMSRDKKGASRFIVPWGWSRAKGVGGVSSVRVAEALRGVGI